MPANIDIYCIDTSSLIDLKPYPMDIFKGLWDNLSQLIKQERLIAPREVLKELERGKDDLLKWSKRNKKMFHDLNPEIIKEGAIIIRKFPLIAKADSETPNADPYIIALAIIKNRQLHEQLCFGNKCLVVTEEKFKPNKQNIPGACKYFGVECINLLDFFRREGWKF